MTSRQDLLILPIMALRRTDVLDATVAMLDVEPMQESGDPGTRCLQISKALGRELGAVLGGAKQ